MTSLDPIPATLSDQLRQLGLVHTAADLNDFIARATQKRWSPVVQLERLVQAELEARLHQRVERRLKDARLGRFKVLADFEWTWPTQIHRPTVERVFTLDFLTQRENVIIVAPNGLGKTMLAKNLVHQAILAGHSARFLTAADLILDLTSQDDRPRPPAPPAHLSATQPHRDRRGRLSRLRRARRGPALSSGESALRAEIDRGDHELSLQTMGHRLPERRLRRRLDRPPHAPCRNHLDRRGVLSQAGGRAGA